MLPYNASFNKDKKIKIIPFIPSDHCEIKLQINSKNNYRKYTISWGLSNTLLNDMLKSIMKLYYVVWWYIFESSI